MTNGPRLHAPELLGDAWFGTGGDWVTLDDLRGRFVLLDFWTLCCVNCHHVLAELRQLEAEFADVLTVIGVHSPKFTHERELSAVEAAISRHGIAHPVLNDPDLHTWQAYAVRAWPTLVLIDPQRRIIGTYSGEGHGHAIAATLRSEITRAAAAGILAPGADPYVHPKATSTAYNNPNKAILLDDNRLFVSNTGNHQLVLSSTSNPNTPQAVLGSGTRGLRDGVGKRASFNEPLGVVQLPAAVAAQVGYDVVVADSANHALRSIRLDDLTVGTVAGTGQQWMQGDRIDGPALSVPLSTPWDVAWVGDSVLVAMAGDHRLWRFDPRTGTACVVAGTSNEGLVDGPAAESWFAQPSALAVAEDTVWVLDAETSALRTLIDDHVATVIGTGLFDFGHVDGDATEALLQHPLGVAVANGGRVLIADTYNGAIRSYDPATRGVSTVARGLREPTDVVVIDDGATLLVVESAAGQLTRVPIGGEERVAEGAMTTSRPVTTLRPGQVRLSVEFTPPPGQHRDERYGPATQLVVTATPPQLLRDGEGRGVDLNRTLVLDPAVGDGVLHVAARGASCDDDSPHASCHIHQQDWGIPVVLDSSGESRLVLPLAGN